MNLLIIGGVAGGATAAARARRLDTGARITVLESGPDVSFANCGLPYFIGGEIGSRSRLILQSPESFHEQYNVVVHTNTDALSIDRERKVVLARNTVTGESAEYPYDALILAQGGRPIVPPIPGAERQGLHTLWTLSDMDAIQEFIRSSNPGHAVVVGGGFIGLEMAEALAFRGLSVTVVEKAPQVMPQLEREIAGAIHAELLANGVSVRTDSAVTTIQSASVETDRGETIPADLVLLSVGVRPTLDLARNAGLAVGDAGGLLVNELLQTSDPAIFAAGDMVEIQHRVSGTPVRIPLAGPANRQGRIAATNALGGRLAYPGAVGTSIVRVFGVVAGSTGLGLQQARAAGIPADAVTVHKDQHVSYFPGAAPVTIRLVYNRETGVVLGAQVAGADGADKRLDVLATAITAGLRVGDLAELDLAYAPPFGSANDPVNMVGFVAANRISGFSPSITVSELDDWFADQRAAGSSPVVVDVRDPLAAERDGIRGAINVPVPFVESLRDELDLAAPILVYSSDGKDGHRALRTLKGLGFSSVSNVSGGFTSVERAARVRPFSEISVVLSEVQEKDPGNVAVRGASAGETAPETSSGQAGAPGSDSFNAPSSPGPNTAGPLLVDVRTPEEFAMGAVDGAINLPLDDLFYETPDLGPADREIVVYCASGARSAYAERMLQDKGYTNVRNGGSLMEMLVSLRG